MVVWCDTPPQRFVSSTTTAASSSMRAAQEECSTPPTALPPSSGGVRFHPCSTVKRDAVLSSRIPHERLSRLFPPSQLQQFPKHYRPSSGVASFLRSDGVLFEDVLDCYRAFITSQSECGSASNKGGKKSPPVQRTAFEEKEDTAAATAPSSSSLRESWKKDPVTHDTPMVGQRPQKEKDEDEETKKEALENSESLRRDFHSDYILWSRAALEDFLEDHILLPRAIPHASPSPSSSSSSFEARVARRKKYFRQWTSRRVLLPDAVVRELFQLHPRLPPRPDLPPTPSASRGLTAGHPPISNSSSSPSLSFEKAAAAYSEYYHFTPFAALQDVALRPIASCHHPRDTVRFSTFPQLFNVFQQEFCSFSALHTLSQYSGDTLVLTQELILHLAAYLRQSADEILHAEPAFLQSGGGGGAPSTVSSAASSSSSIPFPSSPPDAPILLCFGNGRLADALNASGLLHPRKVVSVRLRSQAVAAEKASQLARSEMRKETSVLPQSDYFRSLVHPDFAQPASPFPCQTVSSVQEALRQYRPSLVVVEPHRGGRDYLADLRGYHTVRRVVVLGPIDGPGMASMWFPFLSFGVTPGAQTYFMYNEWLQRVGAAVQVKMPVDAPHEAQGYRKRYLDSEISSWLLSPNDVVAIPHQYRAMVFERILCPRKRSLPTPPL